jgi:FHS family L-fucose permease-like MFS transporter
MIRYAQHEVPGMGEKTAAAYLSWSLVGFMAGRFLGTAAMSRVSPTWLMGLFAGINVALTLVAALVGGKIGLYALAATSFFMSIMFPTIFASSIRGLGPLTKTGSSFLVMSIVGGAVLTAVMGAISDVSAINFAVLVPCACFAVVGLFGLSAGRTTRQDLKSAPAGAH